MGGLEYHLACWLLHIEASADRGASSEQTPIHRDLTASAVSPGLVSTVSARGQKEEKG